MPVEIKELIIRAVVDRHQDRPAGNASGGASGGGARATQDGLDTEALVNACVKQVLKVLDKSRER